MKSNYFKNNQKNNSTANYQKSKKFKYDLSIGLITKNEEKYIERCLKALLPLKDKIACEIIVTDTGSTDKTVEIAEKYADTVLHFEWCDDFASARNTGIEVCAGAWFMFVDADEIFDETVVEIAKFIKSKNRDMYDNATDVIRNYYDDTEKRYGDFHAIRLFNFTKGKRYFNGKIHEAILSYQNTFKIDAISGHYGYLQTIIQEKKDRNYVFLKEEYEKNPEDLRTFKHYFDTLKYKGKIDIFKKAFTVFEKYNESQYSEVSSGYYICVIVMLMAQEYYVNNEFEKAIEICELFYNDKRVTTFEKPNSTASQEMSFIYLVSLFKVKKYEECIEYSKKYMSINEEIEKNQDKLFTTVTGYNFVGEVGFNTIILYTLNAYEQLNNVEGILNTLNNYKIKDCTNSMNLINYFHYTVKYKQKNAAFVLLEELKKEIDIYNDVNTGLYFAAQTLLFNDIDSYLENCTLQDCLSYIINYLNTREIFKLDSLYEFIVKKNEYSNLKEMVIHIKLQENYIVNLSNVLFQKNDSDKKEEIIEKEEKEENKSEKSNVTHDDLMKKQTDLVTVDENELSEQERQELKTKLNQIFETYVKNVYMYVKTIYKNSLFENEEFELLLEQETFCYLVYPSLEQKDVNKIEYIRALKKGLKHCQVFKNVVNNALYFIQQSDNDEAGEEVKPNNEFQLLSEKIKLTIIDAIKNNELSKAKLIIDEYKKINPTDPDIANLINLLNN